jgi:uncharacterized protein YggE
MNPKIKDYLGIALIIGVLMIAVAAWNYSQSFEPASFRSFTVYAEGEATAVPDIAQFSFSVITEGGLEGLEQLKDENARKADAIIDYLKSEDVEKEDIKTTSFSVEPRYSNIRCFVGECPAPEIVGYTIRQSVQVKVRDMDDIGKILSGVVEKGANNVSGPWFTLDDPTEVENEAREEAFKKAKAKAEAMADAGGFKLGKLVSVEEGGIFGKGGGVAFAEARIDSGGGVEEIPIEPGEQEVKITIVLTYEIK